MKTWLGCTTLCFCGFCSQLAVAIAQNRRQHLAAQLGQVVELGFEGINQIGLLHTCPGALEADKVKPFDAGGSGVWRVLDICFGILESNRLSLGQIFTHVNSSCIWKGDCITASVAFCDTLIFVSCHSNPSTMAACEQTLTVLHVSSQSGLELISTRSTYISRANMLEGPKTAQE